MVWWRQGGPWSPSGAPFTIWVNFGELFTPSEPFSTCVRCPGLYLPCRLDVRNSDKVYKALVMYKDFERYHFLPPSKEPLSLRPEQARPCPARPVFTVPFYGMSGLTSLATVTPRTAEAPS